MKGVKLKPLFLKSDDILVSPPDQVVAQQKAEHSEACIASTEQLPSLVRGRKLKKHTHQNRSTEEIEQVKRLTDFRTNSESPSKVNRSPIRRYTFKRLGTMRLSEQPILQKDFSTLVHDSIAHAQHRDGDSFYGVVKAILTKERTIRNELASQTSQVSAANQKFEKYQREKYDFLKRELAGYTQTRAELKTQIENLKQELTNLNKKITNSYSYTKVVSCLGFLQNNVLK